MLYKRKRNTDRPPRTVVYDVPKIPKLPRAQQEGLTNVPADIAQSVIKRANGHCEQCDRAVGTMPFELSHSIPRGMGGTHGERSVFIHSVENLHYLCILCHRQLFHHETYIVNNQSCRTCPLQAECLERARIRGIL